MKPIIVQYNQNYTHYNIFIKKIQVFYSLRKYLVLQKKNRTVFLLILQQSHSVHTFQGKKRKLYGKRSKTRKIKEIQEYIESQQGKR